MLFLYSLPRACVASTRRAVVSILSTLSIFGRAVWTLHPSAGRVAAFGLSSSAARKGRGLVIRQTKGQTLHTRQKNSAGAASSSPHGGRVCVRLSTLSIFGAVCFSCSCLYSLNAAAVGVHIVHIWGVSCNLLNVWRLSVLSIFVHIGGGAVYKPRAGMC